MKPTITILRLHEPEADPGSKFRGGDFSNIWQSSLIMGSLL